MDRQQAGTAAVAGAVGAIVGSGFVGTSSELALGPLRFSPTLALVAGLTALVVWVLIDSLRRRTTLGE